MKQHNRHLKMFAQKARGEEPIDQHPDHQHTCHLDHLHSHYDQVVRGEDEESADQLLDHLLHPHHGQAVQCVVTWWVAGSLLT